MTLNRRHLGVLPYIAPALALYGTFVLWPLVQTGWLALQEWDGYGPQHFVGFANFGALFGDSVFRTALGNSLKWDVGAAVGLPACALLLALAIRAGGLPSLPLAVAFLPALLPPVGVAAIWSLVYSPISGGLNNLLGSLGIAGLERPWIGDVHLALPALFFAWAWSALGISTVVLWLALREVGSEYLDVARSEGAGALWRFFHVRWPGVRRAFVLMAVVNGALAAQVFDLVYVTTGGGPGYATMILPVDMYGRAFGGRVGEGAAVGFVQVVIGLLLAAAAFFVVRRGSESLAGERVESAGARLWTTRFSVRTVVAAYLVVWIAPFYWLLVSALGARSSVLGLAAPSSNPLDWHWSAVSSAWSAGMGSAFGTSIAMGLVVAIAVAVASLLAGFGLGELVRSPALRVLLGSLLAIGLFQPTVVLIVPLFSLLKTLGLLDTAAGVVLPEIARVVPVGILLVWLFLSQLPSELMDGARVDGASGWQRLRLIVTPLLLPVITLVAAWGFITSWNEYLLPTVVSQDSSLQTAPTVLATFIGRTDTQYDLVAGGCIVAIAPGLAVLIGVVLVLVLRQTQHFRSEQLRREAKIYSRR